MSHRCRHGRLIHESYEECPQCLRDHDREEDRLTPADKVERERIYRQYADKNRRRP
mgnify:FL=1